MAFCGLGLPRFIVCSISLVIFVLTAAGCTKGSGSGQSSGKQRAKGPVDPAFQIPDVPAEGILEFVKALEKKQPSPKQREAAMEYHRKFQDALEEASDKILAQKDVSDEILAEAVRMKMIPVIQDAFSQLSAPGADPTAGRLAIDTYERLHRDPRKAVANAAQNYLIAARAVNLPFMADVERDRLVDEAIVRVRTEKGTIQSASDINLLVMLMPNEAQRPIVDSMIERTISVLEELGDEQSKSIAETFRVKLNRLRLPGGTIELSGKMLDGSDFDWESYRGKVVLIDFWATWCGPCVAELPHVVETYKQYHARGFEIVGISLDHERTKLEAFLERSPLPWPTMFSDPEEKTGAQAIAAKYDISQIPTCILVNRDGKVISTEARGPVLQNLLKTLFD